MKTRHNNWQGIILLLAILTGWLGATAWAQKVPATAREAASSPQFAPHLARRSGGQASTQQAHQRNLCSQRPYDDSTVYSNGSPNGTTDAWTINFGLAVADSFPVYGGASVTGMTLAVWLYPGDTLSSAELSITSDPFGGTTYYTGVVTFTQRNCTGNQYGYNVCTETASFPVPS